MLFKIQHPLCQAWLYSKTETINSDFVRHCILGRSYISWSLCCCDKIHWKKNTLRKDEFIFSSQFEVQFIISEEQQEGEVVGHISFTIIKQKAMSALLLQFPFSLYRPGSQSREWGHPRWAGHLNSMSLIMHRHSYMHIWIKYMYTHTNKNKQIPTWQAQPHQDDERTWASRKRPPQNRQQLFDNIQSKMALITKDRILEIKCLEKYLYYLCSVDINEWLTKPPLLANFISTYHKLKSLWKNFLNLWCIFLIDERCGKAQLTVGSAISGLVVLGTI